MLRSHSTMPLLEDISSHSGDQRLSSPQKGRCWLGCSQVDEAHRTPHYLGKSPVRWCNPIISEPRLRTAQLDRFGIHLLHRTRAQLSVTGKRQRRIVNITNWVVSRPQSDIYKTYGSEVRTIGHTVSFRTEDLDVHLYSSKVKTGICCCVSMTWKALTPVVFVPPYNFCRYIVHYCQPTVPNQTIPLVRDKKKTVLCHAARQKERGNSYHIDATLYSNHPSH